MRQSIRRSAADVIASALVLLVLAVSTFAPARAASFDFSAQSGSYFEGLRPGGAMHLDFGPGALDVRQLTTDPETGALVGTGLFDVQGVTDPNASVSVTVGPPDNAPSCASTTVHYVKSIVVTGVYQGTRYAAATTRTEFWPGGECPAEAVTFHAATGFGALNDKAFSAPERFTLRKLAHSRTLTF